jgi:glutathione S-transferase
VKLIEGFGPNPRAVRWFLLEKGLELPREEIDVVAGENRQPRYTDRNPAGQLPALELDDGRVIGETVAIFEYLEERHPDPPLVGRSPEERAETRMWQRRVELNITEHLYNAFRYGEGLQLFQSRMRCLPEAAQGLKQKARDGLAWLDGLLAGKDWIAGERFTIADIILACALDFGASVGQPTDPTLKNVGEWWQRIQTRPAFEASVHPAAAATGMRG